MTEVLQLFTPDRDPEAGDWLIDATGTTAGLLLAELRPLAAAPARGRQTAAPGDGRRGAPGEALTGPVQHLHRAGD